MYLIIGQGAAGATAAIRLRQLQPTAEIAMVSQESDYFYSRIDLPAIVAGKLAPAEAGLRSQQQFADQRITCWMGRQAVRLDRADKTVELDSGQLLSYRRLLLATGSTPIQPEIPGRDAQGVAVLWTLADAQQLGRLADGSRQAVVVGAGLIGLKAALALRSRGVAVTVVEQQAQVLPRQLDDAGSELVTDALRKAGVTVRLQNRVERIVAAQGRVEAVQLTDGQLACQLVVLAVGVRPNTQLAGAAGLAVDGGILVDEYLQTSDPAVFAAGDAAAVHDRLTGRRVVPALWSAAVAQGRLAAENLAGRRSQYLGSLAINAVDIAGVHLAAVGDLGVDPTSEVQVQSSAGRYRRLIWRGDRLRGALLVGEISQAGVLAELIANQSPLDRCQLAIGRASFLDRLSLAGEVLN